MASKPADSSDLQTDVVVSVVALGTLGTGVAYILNYSLIQNEGATTASTVTYLLPIVAVTLGAAVLGETISWNRGYRDRSPRRRTLREGSDRNPSARRANANSEASDRALNPCLRLVGRATARLGAAPDDSLTDSKRLLWPIYA